MYGPFPDVDWSTVDHWAVRIVVKERVRGMKLNYAEKLLAVGQLRRKRVSLVEVADLMNCPKAEVEAMSRRWHRLQESRDRLRQRVSA